MATKGQDLTDREERFCRQYLYDLNATRAAIRAGYSKKTAYSCGPRLMENAGVCARIKELQDARAKRLEIRTDWVLEELANLARMSMNEYASWEGNGTITLTDSADLTPDQMKCIVEVSADKHGRPKLKLHSKTAALDRLCKHLGLDNERKPLDELLDALPAEIADQLRGVLAAVLAARLSPPPKEIPPDV